MAGVLSFTLGLQVNEFLKNMGLAAHEMLSFAAVADGLKKVAEGVWGKIEEGAALEKLSRRTGESVASLYMLQKGFHAAGVGGESVGPMLFQMQKSLGGVNEMGEKTEDIFQRLGLSVGQLKNKSGAEAMQAVVTALSKLNPSSAAKAASGIFGRSGAADALQLSRSMDEVGAAMARAKPQAYVFERVAESFLAIEHGVERVKAIFGPVFLGIAEGIEPALRAAVEWLNKIDLSKIGTGVKQLLLVIQQAFKEGQLYELLTATFSASVEFLENMIVGTLGSGSFWSGIWDQMVGSLQIAIGAIGTMWLKTAMVYQAAMMTATDAVKEALGKVPGLGSKLGLSGFKGQGFKQNYADLKKATNPAQDWLGNMFGSGIETRLQGFGKIKDALAEAIANSGGPAQDALKALFDKLWGNVADSKQMKKESKGGDALDLSNLSLHKTDSNAFEKMGFVTGGPGGPAGYQAETAKNTREMCGLLKQMLGALPHDGDVSTGEPYHQPL